MGWDVKATADAMVGAVQDPPNVTEMMAALPSMDALRPYAGSIAIAVFGILVWAVLRHSSVGKRAIKGLEDAIFTNWQVVVLGSAGLVLSLAAGWTTWDGMRNFTNEPVLSFMITFGIQSVMLIIAWLIGESFATGMHRQAPARSGLSRTALSGVGAVVGLLFFAAVLTLVLQSTGTIDIRKAATDDFTWANYGDSALIVLVGVLTAMLFLAYSASDVLKPYTQGTRIIVRNAMLWVMFLICMATSVFFSFDSRFNVVFPQAERERAAELRAQNQVSGIVSDIGATIATRRAGESETLFQSDGWQKYDAQLGSLSRASQGAQGEIEKYFNEQIEARNRAVKEQQERIATAQSGQVGLAGRKITLGEELGRLKGERPALAATYAETKSTLDAKAKEIDAKRVDAMAEDKGVEGSGKEGRGPIYRERMAELGKLQASYKIAEERVKDAQKRLNTTETRIGQIERELATLDVDLAKIKGETETAETRIKLTQESAPNDDAARIDPARVLPAFESARAEFRQVPAAEQLAKVQQLCSQLYSAMASTPATKDRVRTIDCDPKHAVEAAATLFTLNSGARVFEASCQGGDKLAANRTTDALFGFARKCLADSGLPSKETDQLRTKINFTELTRDDKAHRFVVSWNAFLDGNRLAYLALAIAIGLDSLIFMAGLFAANAVRSPLSDVPSTKGRSAQQLEAIIENALLPDTFENAQLTLQAMRPITNVAGYMAEVRAERMDHMTAARVLKVLNAGSTINAVGYDEERERYLVRSELFEFLSMVSKKAFESNKQHVKLNDLEKIIHVALLPNVGETVDAVLGHLHPINEVNGFTSELYLTEVSKETPAFARPVRNVLNAGSTLGVVQRDVKDTTRYYVHGDLYKTLARIRARTLTADIETLRLPGPSDQGAIQGGRMEVVQARLPSAPVTKALPKAETAGIRRPLSASQLTDFRHHFLQELLAAVGLTEEVVRDRLASDEVKEAVLAAWRALSGHGTRNAELGRLLRDHQKRQEDQLAQAYGRLKNRIGLDERQVDLLDEIEDEVQNALPLLVLFPETGLVDYLIDELESAAEPDDGQLPGEQDLLERLRMVRQALRSLDLADASSWRQIGDLLTPSHTKGRASRA